MDTIACQQQGNTAINRRDLAPAGAAVTAGVDAANLDIGHAVTLMKAGRRVARAGWNGKGMFLYHVGASAYPVQSPAAKRYFGENELVPYGSYVAMRTADGSVVPWLASQTDLLADDWQLLAD
jgi:hypothetical protein